MGGHTMAGSPQITVSRYLKWDAAFRALDVRGPDYPGLHSRCSLQPGLSHGGPSARKPADLKVRNVIAWGEAHSAQPQVKDCLWHLLRPCRAGTYAIPENGVTIDRSSKTSRFFF